MPENNNEKEQEIREFIQRYLKRTNVLTDFGGIDPPKCGFDQRWAGNMSNNKVMKLEDTDFETIKRAFAGIIEKMNELKDFL